MADFEQLCKQFQKANWSSASSQLSSPITAIEWVPHTDEIIAGTSDGRVTSVDCSGIPVATSSAQLSPSRITNLAINNTGDLLATTSFERSEIGITVLNENGIDENIHYLKQKSNPTGISFLYDERNHQAMLVVGTKNSLDIVDNESGAIFRSLEARGGATQLSSWNGCMIAGASSDGVALWDARTTKPVALFGQGSKVRPKFAIDAAARMLVMADKSGNVDIFDVGTKRKITTKPLGNSIKTMAFSSRMRFLVAADEERLFISNMDDLTMGKMPLTTLKIETCSNITGIRWHGSSCKFAVRSSDMMLKVFSPTFEHD